MLALEFEGLNERVQGRSIDGGGASRPSLNPLVSLRQEEPVPSAHRLPRYPQALSDAALFLTGFEGGDTLWSQRMSQVCR